VEGANRLNDIGTPEIVMDRRNDQIEFAGRDGRVLDLNPTRRTTASAYVKRCGNALPTSCYQKIRPRGNKRPPDECGIQSEAEMRCQAAPGISEGQPYDPGLDVKGLGKTKALAFHSSLAVRHDPARGLSGHAQKPNM
jgi:hypothetical protein